MRFWLILIGIFLAPLCVASTLLAQDVSAEQSALRAAKSRASAAEARSENLRQEASNAERAADRVVAQRAVLGAEIDAALAQIDAAKARIVIINRRQQRQRARLGLASEPMLRLNAALQQITGRPTALMIAQPGQRTDYIHLRAVMATVEPAIRVRTAALRQQITIQRDLRAQEYVALKSLNDATARLSERRSSLARIENDSRDRASSLSANAAIEFEQAIAQGERARDIVENIDTLRLSGEKASALASLDGPVLRGSPSKAATGPRDVYALPEFIRLVSGFSELSETGYRERGVTLLMDSGADVTAPAAGKVIFAGVYRSYGKIVIIEHGSGWTSLITNMEDLSIDKGERVRQGSVIGNASAQKPEVGIELRRNGRPIDLAALLG
jgi:murein hydrolase activator